MPQLDELDSATMGKRMDLLSELRSLSTGADPVLEETVLYGVAFHRKFSSPAIFPSIAIWY